MAFGYKFRDLFRPRMVILKEVEIKPRDHVLDYGCGPGSYISSLAELVGKDGKIYDLYEAFKVGKEFISEYVWATICMKTQTLEVFYRAKDQDTAVLIKDFEYELSEEVNDLRQDIGKTS